jgi:hypothetical protein
VQRGFKELLVLMELRASLVSPDHKARLGQWGQLVRRALLVPLDLTGQLGPQVRKDLQGLPDQLDLTAL